MVDDLERAYRERIPALEEMKTSLEAGLVEALDGVAHVDRASFRVKTQESFASKARRYQHPLTDIEDQVAGRVLVFFHSDIASVSQIVCSRWNVVEAVHKAPEKDAEFGYESRHHVFVIPEHLKSGIWNASDEMPTTFEVQIRTLFMHAWAEPQHDLGYKSSSDLSHDVRRQLAWIAASAWGADRAFEEVRRGLRT